MLNQWCLSFFLEREMVVGSNTRSLDGELKHNTDVGQSHKKQGRKDLLSFLSLSFVHQKMMCVSCVIVVGATSLSLCEYLGQAAPNRDDFI
jgi:hypothetical protein